MRHGRHVRQQAGWGIRKREGTTTQAHEDYAAGASAQAQQSKEAAPIQARLTKKQSIFQALKYLAFTISAGAIQAASFTLMNELIRWSYWPSYLIALTLSVVYNFTVNRKFTFKSAKNVPLAMMQIIAYYIVFTPLSTWWGEALTQAGWNDYIVLFGTMVINMITEFSVYRFIVFRKDMYTNKEGQAELARQQAQE